MFILQIFLTDICNLNCPHCFVTRRTDSFIDVNSLKRLLYEGWKLGVDTVTFLGGEPLLAIEQLVQGIKYSRRLGMATRLYTNISLIPHNKEILRIFKKYNVFVGASLYAGSREGYKKYCGVDVYEDVVEGLKLLKSYGINFHVYVMLTKLNKFEFENIVNLLKKLKINGISFWTEGKTDQQKKLKVEKIFLDWEEMSKYITTLNKIIKTKHEMDPILILPRRFLVEKCYAAKDGLAISPTLDIYPCTFSMFPEYKLGNFKDTSLMEALKKGEELRKRLGVPFCKTLRPTI